MDVDALTQTQHHVAASLGKALLPEQINPYCSLLVAIPNGEELVFPIDWGTNCIGRVHHVGCVNPSNLANPSATACGQSHVCFAYCGKGFVQG